MRNSFPSFNQLGSSGNDLKFLLSFGSPAIPNLNKVVRKKDFHLKRMKIFSINLLIVNFL